MEKIFCSFIFPIILSEFWVFPLKIWEFFIYYEY